MNTHTDGMKVSTFDAARLMSHHLAIASLLFEALPSETEPVLAELHRHLSPEHVPAARLWFEAMTKAYEEMETCMPPPTELDE